MPAHDKPALKLPTVTEEDIAKAYREELDVKLREICALMNTALGDGLHTHFSLGRTGTDGDYKFSDLYLSKRF